MSARSASKSALGRELGPPGGGGVAVGRGHRDRRELGGEPLGRGQQVAAVALGGGERGRLLGNARVRRPVAGGRAGRVPAGVRGRGVPAARREEAGGHDDAREQRGVRRQRRSTALGPRPHGTWYGGAVGCGPAGRRPAVAVAVAGAVCHHRPCPVRPRASPRDGRRAARGVARGPRLDGHRACPLEGVRVLDLSQDPRGPSVRARGRRPRCRRHQGRGTAQRRRHPRVRAAVVRRRRHVLPRRSTATAGRSPSTSPTEEGARRSSRTLARAADAVVENFLPHQLSALGLADAARRARRRRLGLGPRRRLDGPARRRAVLRPARPGALRADVGDGFAPTARRPRWARPSPTS